MTAISIATGVAGAGGMALLTPPHDGSMEVATAAWAAGGVVQPPIVSPLFPPAVPAGEQGGFLETVRQNLSPLEKGEQRRIAIIGGVPNEINFVLLQNWGADSALVTVYEKEPNLTDALRGQFKDNRSVKVMTMEIAREGSRSQLLADLVLANFAFELGRLAILASALKEGTVVVFQRHAFNSTHREELQRMIGDKFEILASQFGAPMMNAGEAHKLGVEALILKRKEDVRTSAVRPGVPRPKIVKDRAKAVPYSVKDPLRCDAGEAVGELNEALTHFQYAKTEDERKENAICAVKIITEHLDDPGFVNALKQQYGVKRIAFLKYLLNEIGKVTGYYFDIKTGEHKEITKIFLARGSNK